MPYLPPYPLRTIPMPPGAVPGAFPPYPTDQVYDWRLLRQWNPQGQRGLLDRGPDITPMLPDPRMQYGQQGQGISGGLLGPGLIQRIAEIIDARNRFGPLRMPTEGAGGAGLLGGGRPTMVMGRSTAETVARSPNVEVMPGVKQSGMLRDYAKALEESGPAAAAKVFNKAAYDLGRPETWSRDQWMKALKNVYPDASESMLKYYLAVAQQRGEYVPK